MAAGGAENKYADIIDLPHHQSETHPHMTNLNRAAQFSPFAALTGYEASIAEAARLTDTRIQPGEETVRQLDEKLRFLQAHLNESPAASFTVFRKDAKKQGGAYVTLTGAVKKIDPIRKEIILADGERFYIEDVLEIDVTNHEP